MFDEINHKTYLIYCSTYIVIMNLNFLIQKENIANWKDKSKLFKDKERCVQHSMLSYIKNRLMPLDNCYVIGRFESTSKTCSNCGYVNTNLKLSDRTYNCSKCGMELDRDINAAINIQHMGRMLI